jgi:hypothetical protein
MEPVRPEMPGLPRVLKSLELLVEITERTSDSMAACRPSLALHPLKFVNVDLPEETIKRKDLTPP